MKAITYNNYACLFRKTNKLRNALTYLEKALQLEYANLVHDETSVSESLTFSNPCEIHLNICAILSQLGKHDNALHHAMKALVLIQDELIELAEPDENGNLPGKMQVEPRQTVMIIALHNIAVEYEYLKQYQSALLSYQKSRDMAFKCLGSEHNFSLKMDRVLEESALKIKNIIERSNQRLGAKYGQPSSITNKSAAVKGNQSTVTL